MKTFINFKKNAARCALMIILLTGWNLLTAQNNPAGGELLLELLDYAYQESNGNGMIEPGEEVTIDLFMRNLSPMESGSNVTFYLASCDAGITATSVSVSVQVPGGDFEIPGAFEFSVSDDATLHESSFIIGASTDGGVTCGWECVLDLIIAPSGIFVWDGMNGEPGHSGSFFTAYLLDRGIPVLHSNTYPNSFSGFDAVFLSFGNGGQNGDQSVMFAQRHCKPIKGYLENGGNLYIEGMAIMSIPQLFDWEEADEFHALMGVSSATTGATPNPVSALQGQYGTMMQQMQFTQSNQLLNWYIDMVEPAEGAQVPFVEDYYGNVSVANEGVYGQKTFYLGYALADLVDANTFSSRHHVMARIMDHFGWTLPDNYILANFEVSHGEVLPGEEVELTDLSVSAAGCQAVSWAWDLDEDGIFDVYGQNPVFTYDKGGNYDITLVVTNGQCTDTITRKDAVLVRGGTLVYEGEENGVDQSGIFIRDFLIDNGLDVVYTNRFPESLEGFDAVFASFGSDYFSSPALGDDQATAIQNYLAAGGRMYLEGANALGRDQADNTWLWFHFGIDQVDDGLENPINLLEGGTGSIMEGITITGSTQFDPGSIDIYQPLSGEAMLPAFHESNYGVVAVQFDGAEFFGQKTFCMSYTLAQLDDIFYPNIKKDVLANILEFFEPALMTGMAEKLSETSVRLYPNPATDHATLAFELASSSTLQVEVYDAAGRLAILEESRWFNVGSHEIRLGTAHLERGTYYYRLVSPEETINGKLVIAR